MDVITTMDGAPKLIATAHRQEAEAFEELLRSYHPMVRAYISRHTHSRHVEDWEDLEQLVWVAVWRALPRFRHRAALSTWLVGLTRNIVYSWLRGHCREERGLNEFMRRPPEPNADPSRDTAKDSHWGQLQEALVHLPSKEQTVVRLRFYQGLSDREIARSTGLALGTVKGRIRAGLGHLRSEMIGRR